MNPDKTYMNGKMIPAGSRTFFPLIDRSDSIGNPLDTTVGPEHWYGALYYNIVAKKIKKQTVYFLFGYDGFKNKIDRKLVDVLSFTDGQPYFGAPFFKIDNALQSRFIIEYSEEASISLRYLPKDNIITYDHLINTEKEGIKTPEIAIPDGTYDYFIWKDNLWMKQDLLFDTRKLKKK
jgi:hypothetical protein